MISYLIISYLIFCMVGYKHLSFPRRNGRGKKIIFEIHIEEGRMLELPIISAEL